jgi:tetratricopeptide (TPR) repeat protein
MNPTRLERLIEMRKEDPNDPFLLYAIAMEHQKAQQLELALTFYEELIETHPDYVGTYYHLGKLYEQLKKTDEADACYQIGMKVARKMGDNHAYNELQSAYRSFQGLDEDDEY